jgi:hypothetical protein
VRRVPWGIALSVFLCFCACGTSEPGPLDGVDGIVFLQRQRRASAGDVFQYASYVPGARLMKLSPPTADGKRTVLCCESQGEEFAEVDIMAFDVSFDAREIVFSAKLSSDQSYGLFLLTLENGQVEQLPTDPNRDYVYPVFISADLIAFVTTASVEDGTPPYRDEHARGIATQIGVINRDGSGEKLGGRNLSHRDWRSFRQGRAGGRSLLYQAGRDRARTHPGDRDRARSHAAVRCAHRGPPRRDLHGR